MSYISAALKTTTREDDSSAHSSSSPSSRKVKDIFIDFTRRRIMSGGYIDYFQMQRDKDLQAYFKSFMDIPEVRGVLLDIKQLNMKVDAGRLFGYHK